MQLLSDTTSSCHLPVSSPQLVGPLHSDRRADLSYSIPKHSSRYMLASRLYYRNFKPPIVKPYTLKNSLSRQTFRRHFADWPYLYSPKRNMAPQLDAYFKQVDDMAESFIDRLRQAVAIPSISAEDARRPDVVKVLCTCDISMLLRWISNHYSRWASSLLVSSELSERK